MFDIKTYLKKSELLTLERTHTISDIKTAYRDWCKTHRPDIELSVKDQFVIIKEAYDYLILYHQNYLDQFLNYRAKKSNHNWFVDALNQGLEHVTSTPKRADIPLIIEITPEQAMSGMTKIVSITRLDPCAHESNSDFICAICNNSGVVEVNYDLKINISPNTRDGTRLLIRYQGHYCFSGPRTSVLVRVNIVAGSTRVITLNLRIDFTQALLGDTINITHQHKTFALEIKPGTKNGDSIILNEHNLIIVWNVNFAHQLDERETQLIQDLYHYKKFNDKLKTNYDSSNTFNSSR